MKGVGVLLVGVLVFGIPLMAAPRTECSCLPPAALKFEIVLTQEAMDGILKLGLQVPASGIVGRVYVIITKDGSSEPREQIDVTGVPFWGKDVENFGPGDPVIIADGDPSVRGYPLATLAEIPPGEYYVQAFLNVYTVFHRADGHVVALHQDAGEGQNPWISPGNAHSQVQHLYLDPTKPETIRLLLTEVIPPIQPLEPGEVLQQGNPRDTPWVKFVKIQSKLLSEFWGQPIYIGANILLPKGYDEHPDVYYPVIYLQGHFPGDRAPFGFVEGRGDFYNFWVSDEAPRMIVVTIRDANPYYDTSYSVNSANLGPYGDAIVYELIPYIEEHFRIIKEPWARILAGGSTGGWEALALQIWYPDFFGGCWAWCPDPVDFHYYQLVNIYEDENAYYIDHGWVKAERPSARKADGNVLFTIKQEVYWEQAIGSRDRSGGQWAIWEAVFSPVAPDGYPMPIWDPDTGVIDHTVAEYWRGNYDITYKLRTNWETLGPKLVGKLHITVGDADTYFLNEAVYLLKDFLDSTTNPPAQATFEFGWRKPHCWRGESPWRPGQQISYAEFVKVVADYITKTAPERADVKSWKY